MIEMDRSCLFHRMDFIQKAWLLLPIQPHSDGLARARNNRDRAHAFPGSGETTWKREIHVDLDIFYQTNRSCDVISLFCIIGPSTAELSPLRTCIEAWT